MDKFFIVLSENESNADAILFDASVLNSELGKELISTITKNRSDSIIDNYFKNIKNKNFHNTYIEFNKIIKTSLCKIPIIALIKTNEDGESSLYEKTSDYTIEGHVFYDEDILDELINCRQYLKIWQRKVRSRLWSVLLDNTAQALLEAKNGRHIENESVSDKNKNIEFRLVLEDAFKYMCDLLEMEYCFVRTKLDDKNYICEHSVHADWAEKTKTSKLGDLPMVKDIIAKKEVDLEKIGKEECGIYFEKLKGLYLQGFALEIFGNIFGTLSVFRKVPFEKDDKMFLKRLSEKIASVYGRQRIIEARDAEQEAVRVFSEKAATIKDETTLCLALAEVIFTNLFGKILKDLKFHNSQISNERKTLDKMAKVSIRLLPMGKYKLSCHACFLNTDDEISKPITRREIVIVDKDDPRVGKTNTLEIFSCKEKSNVISCLEDKQEIRFNTNDDMKDKYLMTDSDDFKAEGNLCVPLIVKSPSGNLGAIGVINAEYYEQHFFTDEIAKFVEILAIITTTTLLKIRQNNALQSLMAFVKKMASDKVEKSIQGIVTKSKHANDFQNLEQINNIMEKFIGHGVFVYFIRPSKSSPIITTPWTIKLVILGEEATSADAPKEGQLRLSNKELKSWQEKFKEKWGETFTKKSIQKYVAESSQKDREIESQFVIGEIANENKLKIPEYTEDKKNFMIDEGLLYGREGLVTANAVVPLYNSKGELSAVWLFEWFNHSAMNENSLSLLYDFADTVSRFENFV